MSGRSLSSSGRSSSSSGRYKEEEEHLEQKARCKDWKKEEKKNTYLLVPEPGTSPGTSVPASSRSLTSSAASSTSSPGTTTAASSTPGGRRGRWKGARVDRVPTSSILMIAYIIGTPA